MRLVVDVDADDLLKAVDRMFFGVRKPALIVVKFEEGKEPKHRSMYAREFFEKLFYIAFERDITKEVKNASNPEKQEA
jgi:hypothetical protein